MADVFVIDAVRTPIGRAAKGSLTEVRPDDLAAAAVRALLKWSGISGSDVAARAAGVYGREITPSSAARRHRPPGRQPRPGTSAENVNSSQLAQGSYG